MKKLLSYKFLTLASSFLMAIAVLNIKPACMGTIYQPRMPKCLKN